MKKLPLIILTFISITFNKCSNPDQLAIVISSDASFLEHLAAKEIRRYVYLRTDELLTISDNANSGQKIIELKINNELDEQEFSLKTAENQLIISGGTPQAILFGAYEFAEQLGVRFYLHGDVIPDEKIVFLIPELNIQEKPLFKLRGIQPFHDFPEGPDWWNEQDYKAIIAQLAKMKMNFVGFHTYPERENFDGDGYKAEPLVWIGKEEDVKDDGTVKASYPVLHFHTQDSTWGYSSMNTSDFSLGASQIFETDNYGADYIKTISNWPHTEDENIKLFNDVGKVFNKAFSYAHSLGIKTSVGTETFVTIPTAMKERYGIEEETEEEIKDIYRGMFDRITKTYPLDYYWLWTPEYWTWQGVSEDKIAETEKDILLAHEVLTELNMPFNLATCGWVLGPPNDRAQFDRVLPKDMPFSCINRGVGYSPLEKGFLNIEGRSKWAIPWMEDDPDMISTQLWVGRLRKDALDAYRYGCDGLFGIHWRTRILGPNVSALAKAAWTADEWLEGADLESRDVHSDDFYRDWVKSQFGVADDRLVEILTELDSKGVESKEGHKGDAPLNASEWIKGPGALMMNETSTERIVRYDFISELESYSAQIVGAGNKERFNYWLNSFKFNKAMLETALSYKELSRLMTTIEKTKEPKEKHRLTREEALPKRIELAENWTNMVNILLSKLSTNGELGNLANLEMHSNKKFGYLNGFDAQIETLLGDSLPSEALLSHDYQGKDRVLVFTNPSALHKDDNFHIRVRVLSNASNIHGKLMWKKLGEEAYQEIPLTHMARNVFEVNFPVPTFGEDFEYYVEMNAGGKELVYPATAKEINCSVLVLK